MTGCGESEETDFYILLLDEDENTILYNEKVSAGEKIEGIITPTKEADPEYTYTFSGWVDSEGNKVVLSFATKNVTAYATYTATKREYSLTVTSNGEEVFSYDQVEILRDGIALVSGMTVNYGDKLDISVNGAIGYTISSEVSYSGLQRASEEDEYGNVSYYYIVVGDVKISYTEEQEIYTVIFYDVDGTKLCSTTATYGSSVTYPKDDPTRETDLRASYRFDNWVDSSGNYVNLNKITGDTKVYAQYVETYIPYYLTIASGAKVYVYKNGTQLTSGAVIYYGDVLEIVTNPAEGYYTSALKINDDDASLVDGTTSVTVDEKGVSITGYEETIYTFSVTLYNESTIFYETTVDYGTSISGIDDPTKDSTLRSDFSFMGWIDADGNEISLKSIKGDIVGYADYEEILIQYSLTVKGYAEILNLTDNQTYTSENYISAKLYYGDYLTISVSEDLPDDFAYYDISIENADYDASGNYVISGNVVVTVQITKSFVDYIYSDLQKISYFVDEDGTKYTDYTTKDSFAFYKYIGTEEHELTAVYVDFLSFSALEWDSNTHTTNWNSTTKVLTPNAGIQYTDYLTTPLYKGMKMTFEFVSYDTWLIGLATAEEIASPGSYVYNPSDSSANYNLLYVPEYNIFKYGTSSDIRTAIANKANYTTYSGWSNYTNGTTITVTITLGSTLTFEFVGSDGSSYTLESSWEISENTPYYFTFMSSKATSVLTIKSFGFTESFESLYLKFLSGKTISFIGDSLTYGTGATTDSNKYSTVLTSSLGMKEVNKGQGGTVYCDGNSNRTSRIYDVSTMDADSEIAIILLGINDFNNAWYTSDDDCWATLGEFGSTDTSTIYGATNAMFASYVEYFAKRGTKLYVSSTAATRADVSTTQYAYSGGYTIQELNDAIREVAESYGIEFIDIYNGVEWTTSLFNDNLHPNDDGYAAMADYMYNQILEGNMYDYVLSSYGY